MDPYVIGLAVAGWLATTWLAYRWGLHSKKLDRQEAARAAAEARRREFCAFLRGWRKDFDSLIMKSHGFMRDAGSFVSILPSFIQKAEMVRGDLSSESRRRFDDLVGAISSCDAGHFHDANQYKELLRNFDGLISYVENA
jgi:hypothetical protein